MLRRVHTNKLEKGYLGPTECLGKENEERLGSYTQSLKKIGYSSTLKDVKHLAFTFAKTAYGVEIIKKFNSQAMTGLNFF